MAIHYIRDAPISDMASDYVQAKAARENLKQAGNIDTSLKKIKNVVEATVQHLRDEIKALNNKSLAVERRAVPGYVINRSTNHVHRILSSYADAGHAALANCGSARAKPGTSTKFVSEVPEGTTWEEVCSTCLPEVRARLKGR